MQIVKIKSDLSLGHKSHKCLNMTQTRWYDQIFMVPRWLSVLPGILQELWAIIFPVFTDNIHCDVYSPLYYLVINNNNSNVSVLFTSYTPWLWTTRLQGIYAFDMYFTYIHK